MLITKLLLKRNVVPKITQKMQDFSNSHEYNIFPKHFSKYSEWPIKETIAAGKSDGRQKKIRDLKFQSNWQILTNYILIGRLFQ